MASNLYQPFLEDNPDILYYGMTPKSNSSRFLDYYRSQYNPTYNAYKGAVGNQALSGQTPSLSFYDYLMNNNPVWKEWLNLSPTDKGFIPSLRSVWNIR
ncbi:MAG: hypothetical protein WC455_15660 [Dehalococcoidia bacterium]|jgi:hypothetical protein